MPELREIAVSDLLPDPDQPRKDFDERVILALADSIKAIGVQVPLIVFALEGVNREGIKHFIVDGVEDIAPP